MKKPIKIRLEMDEMWGRVEKKGKECWLWHAINHTTGDIIAYVLSNRKQSALWKLWELISDMNLNITDVYSDNNFSYSEVIPNNVLTIGKNNTQKIERKHLTFRTRLKRLARKTICFSKSLEMHKIMVGLLINSLEFNCKLF